MSKTITEEQLEAFIDECYRRASYPREHVQMLAKELNKFFTCDCGGACKKQAQPVASGEGKATKPSPIRRAKTSPPECKS